MRPLKKALTLPSRVPKGFVELLGRSNFSFLQGASHPEEMVEQAIRQGYDGIGICDLNGLYGVARGYQAASSPSLFTASANPKENFKYLLGTELHLVDETAVILMPMNKQGYSRLCELLTLGKRDVAKGFSKLCLEDVCTNSENLLCFLIEPLEINLFSRLKARFHDRLYIPIWRDLTWESFQRNQKAFKLEKNGGIDSNHSAAQLTVSNRPFMHSSERKPLFDVLTCTLHHTNIDQAKNILLQNGERYLRPLNQLYKLWQDRPDLVEKTLEVASRVDFSLSEIRYRYPASALPLGLSPKDYLSKLTLQGLEWRYGSQIPIKVQEMVKHELSVINDLQYEDYFLTLYEICEFAKKSGILYQGRGSAANSVVCFALGLTSVDPMKIDLLFERFISRERGEPPDIDIDFEHERREEVIQHIYQKYGEQHAAMVCTVIRYRSRMALRETCKVFGVPLKTVNALIQFMGRDGMRRLKEVEVISKNFAISPERWTLILALTQELQGFPRHLGIHSGGFLITHDPITEMVPVEKASMQGRYVIQWNKDDVNFLKLMKIDVLSLGMLSAIRKALVLLRSHKNLDYNLATVPSEDRKTYQMISQAETVGVFQIESRAQMNTLPRLRPQCFYDLVVEVALIRPGPLQGGMVHPYLKRRQGLEKVEYPHPDLKLVLGKTLGVPIFQEQVMKIAVVAAGFSPGEADELRRVMSNAWRKKGTMDGIRTRIMKGLKENGISDQYSEQIYKTIEGFANYGFPESHAASFALLTYVSCYLKCHHPEVFTCALLNSQPMGFYPPRVLIADAQRSGVQVSPLSINYSDYDYSLEPPLNDNRYHCLRTGLRSIYGLPKESLLAITEERNKQGAYQCLDDFIQRTSFYKSKNQQKLVQKVTILKLAAAGAFSEFQPETRKLLWQIESLSLDENSFLFGKSREDFSLAADQSPRDQSSGDESISSEQPHLPFESNWDLLTREYNTKGFSIEYHPLSIMRPSINQRSEVLRSQRIVPFYSSKDLQKLNNKTKIRVAGLISVHQRPPTAKGFCFITLEDEFGFINVVIAPDIYQKDRMTIYSKSLLEVQGVLEVTGKQMGGVRNLRAERVLPLTIG